MKDKRDTTVLRRLFALLQASEHGTAFSHMLTSGNVCDIDVADQIAYATPQAWASVIAFPASGNPNYVTSVTIDVTGGQ